MQRLIELRGQQPRYGIAALNVQATQAQYRVQRRSSSDHAVTAEQIQKNPSGHDAAQGTSTGTWLEQQHRARRPLLRGGVGSVYEIDFFGKIRSLNQERLEPYLSSRKPAEHALSS